MNFNFKTIFTLWALVWVANAVSADSVESSSSINDTIAVQEVVVTGTRPSVNINNLPMSVSVVSGKQIERRMEQSLLPILTERVPSLFITSRGVMGYGVSTGSAGGMTIRGIGGAPTTQLLVLLDGHPQYMGLMGHPLADTYQSLMAERVEVVRGPASVLYGSNAMGGVINIITKQQKEDGVHTHLRAMYGSYNTLTTEATNAVRSGKFNSYLSLGYNHSDNNRDNMDFEQYTAYAKVGYDFTPNWKSFVDLDITQFDSSNPGEVDAPVLDNDMNVTRGVTSFSLQNDYKNTSGALKFYYNFGSHKINDGYSPGDTPEEGRFRSKDRMLGVTLYQSYRLFNGNQTTAGIDYQHFGGHAWNKYVTGNPNSDIVEESLNEVAGYVNFQQMLFDKLTLNAGVRLDHHSKTGNEWIPQIGLSYFAGENTVLKGIVSKGFRNPTIRELYMFRMRNPDLEPESLMNYEISLLQYLLNRKLQLGANLYYIKGKNSIVLVMEGGVPQWRNTEELENYGFELTGDYQVNMSLSLNANYSYIHMENDIIGTPEHKLYVGLDYTIDKWAFSTGVQFIHNLIKDITEIKIELEDGTEEIQKKSIKETFTLWDARVTYRVNKMFDVFARGENLLAQKYETNVGYPMPRATVFAGFSLKL